MWRLICDCLDVAISWLCVAIVALWMVPMAALEGAYQAQLYYRVIIGQYGRAAISHWRAVRRRAQW